MNVVHTAASAVAGTDGHSFLLLLSLLLVPLVGAGVLMAFKHDDRIAKLVALVFALAEFVLAVIALFGYDRAGARLQFAFSVDWIPSFGVHIAFGMDGIALVLVAMIGFLVPIVLGASWTERLPEGRSVAGFFALILTLEALLVGVFSATDVFLFYVLFELMLIPMYFLIGSYGGVNRRYAAVKFFLYSFLGGLLMLASAIGMWSYAQSVTGNGTFDWATLTTIVSHAPLSTQIWLFMGFFFAFAIKAPLVPFHTWLPDATAEAPVGVGVLLVGVLDKVGIFGFLRYNLPLLPDASHTLAPLLLVLAVAGVLYGSILAAGQSDMKRFIAYVSLAHFGFMALGVFAFSAQGTVGTVTYMVNHSIATGLLLLVVGMVAVRGRSVRAEDYGGMAKVTPILAGVMFLAGLTTLSLPGTNSFVSEFLVLIGSYRTQPVYTILATVGMVLAALYVLWLYQRVMQGPVRGNALVGVTGGPGAATDPALGKGISDATGRERWVLAPMVVLILLLGFYPKPLLDIVNPSVGATLNSIGVSVSQEGK
ncbi:MAG TPA: NADH-quinone oxidoreductase subunit M [Pseudonocardiaceae bacterium]|jgi:NADH-quinone oxidoreductase subunit M|nr:NADH-quinone oxidoreductase subunit M [Pseudonocardiaceae bacterium]